MMSALGPFARCVLFFGPHEKHNDGGGFMPGGSGALACVKPCELTVILYKKEGHLDSSDAIHQCCFRIIYEHLQPIVLTSCAGYLNKLFNIYAF